MESPKYGPRNDEVENFRTGEEGLNRLRLLVNEGITKVTFVEKNGDRASYDLSQGPWTKSLIKRARRDNVIGIKEFK